MARKLNRKTGKILAAICILVTIVHIYVIYIGTFEIIFQRSLHLALIITLAFIFFPATKKSPKDRPTPFDLLCASLSFVSFGYIALHSEQLALHTTLTRSLALDQIVMGTIAILIIFEASRRIIGWPLSAIAAVFIAYMYAGPYLPELLSHRGYSWPQIIDTLYLGREGIFGVPVHVSFTYLFPLIVFSNFFAAAGGVRLFSNLAKAITGRMTAGPAKAMLIANYFLGMVTGNAIANVYLTAGLAKDDMKKQGYTPNETGALIASAAVGAQISPPILGAVAFLIVEFLGVSYLEVCIMSIIPAFFFYLSLFLIIDLKARKLGVKVLEQGGEKPTWSSILKDIHLFLPVIVFVWLLVEGYSIPRIAIYSTLSALIVSYLRRHTWMNVRSILKALEDSARNIILIATALAASGIILGGISLSGLAYKFTHIAIVVSGGMVLPLLILTATAAIVLGFPLPPSAAYVMSIALLVPAMYILGVEEYAAHMFLFYFCVFAVITPPEANVAYAAAQIVGGDLFKTGFEAMKFSLVGFIVPFMFVYSPALLMKGEPTWIAWSFITAFIGVCAFSMAIVGQALRSLNMVERALMIVCAMLLIFPEVITDFIGFGLFGAILFLQSPWLRSIKPIK